MRASDFLIESADVETVAKDFLTFAQDYLKLDTMPKIKFLHDALAGTFGHYSDGRIEVVVAGRHPNDVMRTLAHELVHYKQELEGRIHDESGATGSNEENEANAEAGIMMRHYNQKALK